ncbi:hypothetical protein [Duganella sp. LjRoot269]|jgi:hypothetical protein|uniref:hypothetical protein n=1 Tax=Duganella sp. LjRoot269 TaxID=3342305 RepID=UPI003ED09999
MHLGVVVQQASLIRPTTPTAFVNMMTNFPFTGAARPKDWIAFIKVAEACCTGGHAAQKVNALARILGVVELGTVSAHFTQLSIPMIAWQLVARVLEPRLLEQAGYGLCGPATFAVHLAKTRPVEYVEFAYNLLKSGTGKIGTIEVKPNKKILEHNPVQIPDADWLVLASVRNSDQSLDSNHAQYGGTTFHEMVNWLKQANYGTVVGANAIKLTTRLDRIGASLLGAVGYGVVQAHPSMPACLAKIKDLHEPMVNLGVAGAMLANHWKVFLMITEKLASSLGAADPIDSVVNATRQAYINMGQVAPDSVTAAARAQAIKNLAGTGTNHWVMAKEINISHEGKVSVVRYSYGTKAATAPIDLDVFMSIYGGFVAINEMGPVEASAAWH